MPSLVSGQVAGWGPMPTCLLPEHHGSTRVLLSEFSILRLPTATPHATLALHGEAYLGIIVV
jgi:hypothetical protein